jgi:hypothetical protein
MGSALAHLETIFPSMLSTAHIETTQINYMITATWIPHTTIPEPVPSAAGDTPAIDDPPPDHLLPTASLTDRQVQKRKKYPWNAEEDIALASLMRRRVPWGQICEQFPNRTPAAVKMRGYVKKAAFFEQT